MKPWDDHADEIAELLNATDHDVLTVDEGAALLRIGRRQMYEAIGRGEIPHRRIGRSIRLSRAVLLKWLDSDAKSADTGHRSCGLHQKGTV